MSEHRRTDERPDGPAGGARLAPALQDSARGRTGPRAAFGRAASPKAAAGLLAAALAALTVAFAHAGGGGGSAGGDGAAPSLLPVAEAGTLAQGELLYAASCAACHGTDLEGQPDWKRRLPSGRMPAPPHDETGHTWHHSDAQLFQITKEGVGSVVEGYESDMPAFGGLLSDEEIHAILAYIKSIWPERQREYQEEITRAAKEAAQ